ncbi:MAG: S8 family serine peptidase, partial [Akkermansiaceae bacterium]|nr:S8 family serine peptidase [Akkermansiaceae bacterium]
MRPSHTAALVLSTWALPISSGFAQQNLADLLADPQTHLSQPAERDRVVRQMAAIEHDRRQNARARATQLGLPLRLTLPGGRIQEIADFDLRGLPLYLTTANANAAISTGANLLRSAPFSLSGSGFTIGLWDGGSARSTHQEFGIRVTVKDGALAADHSTHVGGTLIATGVVAAARGMANGATVDSYDWNSDTSEMTSRAASAPDQTGKIYLSNHSYSYVSGWDYVNSGSPTRVWEWNGYGTSSSAIEDDFGRYNTYARDSDSLAFNAPYFLMFRAAGNERTDNPTSGQAVALAPGSSSVVAYNPATHPAGDGSYRGGFETIGFNAVAKNVITVGSVSDAVTSGSRNVAAANISTFSSWGPTDDGRIKPDVVANGENLYSPLASSNTAYGSYSGTSMATPNACGSAALLIQHYGNLFPGQAMRSSTLKGLLIHTADDRGNAGPDYKFGWGLINVKAAADLLSDQLAVPAKQRLTESQLTSSITTRSVSFLWDGVSPISATLCWTDPAGSATTTSDLRTRRLVNDLNLKIIAPGGGTYLPFVMPFVGTWTQTAMNLPATTGINATDNVEQVRIAAPPAAGTYQAVVSFAGTLTNSSQYYSLLISGSSAEPPPPPPLVLSSVSPASGLSSGTTTLTLTGTGLRADTTVKLTRSGQPDIPASSVQKIGENLSCQVDLTDAAAGAWDVVATNPDPETSTLTAAFTIIGAVWSDDLEGPATGWSSESLTGTNSWSLSTARSHSPATSYFASGPSTRSTTALVSPAVFVPTGATSLQLRFWHWYSFQPSRRDGGRLEFQIDSGPWTDIVANGTGNTFASNGYVSTINSNSNDFNKLPAWTGSSGGAFLETIVNLNTIANYTGRNLRFRWLLATNAGTSSTGWNVDSVALIAGGDLSNQPPAITSAATSTSAETVTDPDGTVYQVIRAATAELSVAATDDSGEPALTYTWNVLGGPAVPVTFSVNATNAAKATDVEFGMQGDYAVSVTVRDEQGISATSIVNLRVMQSASGLIVTPIAATIPFDSSQSFTATLIDQFTGPLDPQPESFQWTSSSGTINESGLFTPTTAGGPFVITAAAGGFGNTAAVTVTPAPATVGLSNLLQTYDGIPKAVTVTTVPANLAVAVSYGEFPAPPTEPGSYAVTATITDPGYLGAT